MEQTGYRTLTAAQRKLIGSLSEARHRRKQGLFVAEGLRTLRELLPVFPLRRIVATASWLGAEGKALEEALGRELRPEEVLIARGNELREISTMTTPQGVLAVFDLPVAENALPEVAEDELILALDRVQDPGNLGTILRLADWFGVRNVLASADTVDVFNPKVLQSTMGALARVRVTYCDLAPALKQLKEKGMEVYGTFLDGADIYRARLSRGGVIVMGNEGNGISDEVAATVSFRLLIPSYPPDVLTVESLNVGTATAITLAEFRRRL